MRETMGEYIHGLRISSAMTLTKLAAALDLDQSTLSKIENGKRKLPENVLPKLAKIFNLEIKNLEKEYYSEKIAEIIYLKGNSKELLSLAEEKANYMRFKRQKQRTINFSR